MNDETKPQAKKQWTKPQLLVLVRSNPEEAVLSACKSWNVSVGAMSHDSKCLVDVGCGTTCSAYVSS